MNILYKYSNNLGKNCLLLIIAMAVALSFGKDAQAGGGAFVGGMLAGHLVTGAVNRSKARTQAEEYAAYSQPATQQTSTKSIEQKLGELDTLAAKGYITKSEYKSRKNAILDQM